MATGLKGKWQWPCGTVHGGIGPKQVRKVAGAAGKRMAAAAYGAAVAAGSMETGRDSDREQERMAAGVGRRKSGQADYAGKWPVEVAGMGWPGGLSRKVVGGSCRNGRPRKMMSGLRRKTKSRKERRRRRRRKRSSRELLLQISAG